MINYFNTPTRLKPNLNPTGYPGSFPIPEWPDIKNRAELFRLGYYLIREFLRMSCTLETKKIDHCGHYLKLADFDITAGLQKSLQPCSRAARKWRENEEMKRKRRGNGERMRKWRGNEEMERDWLSTFPHFVFISYIKICHILMQNAKYGTFVANVTKIITYALWGNTSGSDLLRGSSASCAGLQRASISQVGWFRDLSPGKGNFFLAF